jgi:hypothetical protein
LFHPVYEFKTLNIAVAYGPPDITEPAKHRGMRREDRDAFDATAKYHKSSDCDENKMNSLIATSKFMKSYSGIRREGVHNCNCENHSNCYSTLVPGSATWSAATRILDAKIMHPEAVNPKDSLRGEENSGLEA